MLSYLLASSTKPLADNGEALFTILSSAPPPEP